MNGAHLHLILNHFPIVGLFFGLAILGAGIAMKQELLRKTAYVIFIFVALINIPVFLSGEEAEDIVEAMGISHDLIHEHEEIAEMAIWLVNALGLLALAALWMTVKKKPLANALAFLTLLFSIGVLAVMGKVGATGGEIRHEEIRKDFVVPEKGSHKH